MNMMSSDVKMLKRRALRGLEREIEIRGGRSNLIDDMYSHFYDQRNTGVRFNVVFRGIFMKNYIDFDTRLSFYGWVEEEREHNIESFKTLLNSDEALLLAFSIYRPSLNYVDGDDDDYSYYEIEENTISVRSSDNVVFEINKDSAMSQSWVLRDLFLSTGSQDEIPLLDNVNSIIVQSIDDFCKNKHIFDNLAQPVMNFLKDFLAPYKDCVTRFLSDNNPCLSLLNKAAHYLDIPSLFNLTSRALADKRREEHLIRHQAGLSNILYYDLDL